MGFDLVQLIETVGYIGLLAIIFAESGLFFGFFLPGDSLLLTAGLLASHGDLKLWILLVTLAPGAYTGVESPAPQDSGVGLIEIYDLSPAPGMAP